jgi:hypothetical protein
MSLAQGKDAAVRWAAASTFPCKGVRMSTSVAQSSAKVTTPVVKPSVFLTPSRVEKMLAERRSFQIVKFRTNCSDCVPNL